VDVPAATDDADADQSGVANTTEAAATAMNGDDTDDVATDAIGDSVDGYGPDEATPTGA